MNRQQTYSSQVNLLRPIASILLVSIIFVVMLIAIALGSSVGGSTIALRAQSLFAMNSVQIWWYVTRASGLTGYFLLWLSMVWGFAVSTKLVQPILDSLFTYDFHEYLSLLGIGFIIVHVAVLLFDKYLPFSLLQLLIPFIDTYR